MTALDRTHRTAHPSWVASAKDHPQFPIQNLPWGRADEGLVVAIGDEALLIREALAAGWGAHFPPEVRGALRHGQVNALASCPPDQWRMVRHALFDALSDRDWEARLRPALRPQSKLTMRLPMHVGDYTDFYASVHHATNVGSMFRPDQPLLPNYKWVPIGYHGRSSSIVIDETPVRRPTGQVRAADAEVPTFGPSRSLDYELELGLVIGGHNRLGEATVVADAADRIFGVVLLNDWSARDVQAWEYQPLGPFLAKNFATTVSPWIVTMEALKPFRVPMPPRPAGDPAPLPHLALADDWTWALELEVELWTLGLHKKGMPPHRVSQVRFDEAMYWSPSQLVAHHTSNGCNLNPGDLLGTGTISGPTPDSRGCLLERTWRGSEPLQLPDGTERRFLEDGDQVILRGRAVKAGAVPIGFGACRGFVLPA
ncbi:MAG TPA: fumarylacetoacetase [Gemmatimonadales bacterium]|nr:fumarylacetoacetase [Gemmatimonadales bacterium]